MPGASCCLALPGLQQQPPTRPRSPLPFNNSTNIFPMFYLAKYCVSAAALPLQYCYTDLPRSHQAEVAAAAMLCRACHLTLLHRHPSTAAPAAAGGKAAGCPLFPSPPVPPSPNTHSGAPHGARLLHRQLHLHHRLPGAGGDSAHVAALPCCGACSRCSPAAVSPNALLHDLSPPPIFPFNSPFNSSHPPTPTQGSKFLLEYASTKAAIVGFTRSLALQLAPQGIRVNAVAAGPVSTCPAALLRCCSVLSAECRRPLSIARQPQWDSRPGQVCRCPAVAEPAAAAASPLPSPSPLLAGGSPFPSDLDAPEPGLSRPRQPPGLAAKGAAPGAGGPGGGRPPALTWQPGSPLPSACPIRWQGRGGGLQSTSLRPDVKARGPLVCRNPLQRNVHACPRWQPWPSGAIRVLQRGVLRPVLPASLPSSLCMQR